MVSEEWGYWLLVTPVYPLRRGHDEYPGAAPDRGRITALRGILSHRRPRQVSGSFGGAGLMGGTPLPPRSWPLDTAAAATALPRTYSTATIPPDEPEHSRRPIRSEGARPWSIIWAARHCCESATTSTPSSACPRWSSLSRRRRD